MALSSFCLTGLTSTQIGYRLLQHFATLVRISWKRCLNRGIFDSYYAKDPEETVLLVMLTPRGLEARESSRNPLL